MYCKGYKACRLKHFGYIRAMILSIDAQESIFSYISKNKMPFIGVANVAALTSLSSFVYQYMVYSKKRARFLPK